MTVKTKRQNIICSPGDLEHGFFINVQNEWGNNVQTIGEDEKIDLKSRKTNKI